MTDGPYRVGRSWGVTVVYDPERGEKTGQLWATAQTPEMASDIVDALNAWASDAPNQTETRPVDSELRDRLASALAADEHLSNDWSDRPQAYLDRGIVDTVMSVVAPVLAERDAEIKNLKKAQEELSWQHNERRSDCDKVKEAIGPVLYTRDFRQLRAGWMAKEAMQALSDARSEADRLRAELKFAEATRQQYAEERDKAVADAARLGAEIRAAHSLLLELGADHDWPHPPPSLADRIHLLRLDLDGERMKVDLVRWLHAEAVWQRDKAREEVQFHGRRWLRVESVLDEAIGTEPENGAGEGLASDVALLAEQRDQARADLEALKTKQVWRTAPISGVMHLVPRGDGRRESVCGLTAITTWRDAIDGNARCLECMRWQPDTEATDQAEPRSDVAVLPGNWEDIVETHSTYVNGRCGCGELCPDRDALARHREAVLTPATPTEPRRLYDPTYEGHEGDVAGDWVYRSPYWLPADPAEVTEVVEDQAGGEQ